MKRRTLLAERLLQTVFGERSPTGDEAVECEAVEPLVPDVTEAVCDFLGHPDRCPHGNSIPAGTCCEDGGTETTVVERLGALPPGARAQVVYIVPNHPAQMIRLSNFGLVAGSEVELVQTRPAVVLAVGPTEVALDRDFIDDIYVRRVDA